MKDPEADPWKGAHSIIMDIIEEVVNRHPGTSKSLNSKFKGDTHPGNRPKPPTTTACSNAASKEGRPEKTTVSPIRERTAQIKNEETLDDKKGEETK